MSSDSGAADSATTGSGGTAGGIATQASAAIDQFRSVGKWIITSFAAVGALLLTGIQLTSLGSATGVRLYFALGGLAIAVVAVIGAIASLTSLLEPHVSAPDDAIRDADNPNTPLGKFVREHRGMLFPSGISTAEGLSTAFDQARSSTAPRQPAEEKRFQDLKNGLSDIVWWSSYEGAKKRFDHSRMIVILMAFLIGAGVVTYALAATSGGATANVNSSSNSVVDAMPVQVIVKLTPTGRSAFNGILGKSCIAAAVSRGVPAIALSADSSQTTVILIPTAHACSTPTRVSLPISEGVAMPVSLVKPAASANSTPRSSAKPTASASVTPKSIP